MEQEEKDLQMPKLSGNMDAPSASDAASGQKPVPQEGAKRQLEAAPGVPQPENQLPSLAQMQHRGDSQKAAAAAKRKPSKMWLLLLALVFLLFCTILIIPVSRLPGMNSWMSRLGLSASDVQSMSLGKFLWTWAGGGGDFSGMRAGTGSGAMRSIFDNNQAPDFNANGPKSGLFDLAAVNADRRARGLSAEDLYGAYYGDDDEAKRAALGHEPKDWSAEAQAANARKNVHEVYFGTDAELYARAGEGLEQRGSSDTAKLLPRSAIRGTVPPDWLNAAIGKASRLSESDMTRGVEKASEITVGLSRLNGRLTAGKPSQRDLARVWLLSNAANKAHQPMLKKQLASAGYMAMEIPQKVYDSFGDSSGLMMRGDEIINDFSDTNKKMLDDEQCRKLAAQANGNIDNLLNQARQTISTIRSTKPMSCDSGAITAWVQQLSAVSGTCKQVQQQFSNVSGVCAIQQASAGNCSTPVLTGYAVELNGACGELADLLNLYNLAQADWQAAIAALDQAIADEKQALKIYQDADAAYQAALKQDPPPDNLELLKAAAEKAKKDYDNSVNARIEAQGKEQKAHEKRNDAKYNYDEQNIKIYGNSGAKGVENIPGKPAHAKDNGIVNNTGDADITASFNLDEGLDQAGTNTFFPEVGEGESKEFLNEQTEFDRG